jgi:NhaP-type Na+/H+ and K+/H+ antiporter
MKDSTPPEWGKWTMGKVLKHLHQPLEAMPSVITALKHALTFGASTALCENPLGVLIQYKQTF